MVLKKRQQIFNFLFSFKTIELTTLILQLQKITLHLYLNFIYTQTRMVFVYSFDNFTLFPLRLRYAVSEA